MTPQLDELLIYITSNGFYIFNRMGKFWSGYNLAYLVKHWIEVPNIRTSIKNYK